MRFGKLLKLDRITLSAETVRRLQIGRGLWRPKTRRARRALQLRERRQRFGELIQIDGSPHDWFEGRGPRCTLIGFIDDATSRLPAQDLVNLTMALWRATVRTGWLIAFRIPPAVARSG